MSAVIIEKHSTETSQVRWNDGTDVEAKGYTLHVPDGKGGWNRFARYPSIAALNRAKEKYSIK